MYEEKYRAALANSESLYEDRSICGTLPLLSFIILDFNNDKRLFRYCYKKVSIWAIRKHIFLSLFGIPEWVTTRDENHLWSR